MDTARLQPEAPPRCRFVAGRGRLHGDGVADAARLEFVAEAGEWRLVAREPGKVTQWWGRYSYQDHPCMPEEIAAELVRRCVTTKPWPRRLPPDGWATITLPVIDDSDDEIERLRAAFYAARDGRTATRG